MVEIISEKKNDLPQPDKCYVCFKVEIDYSTCGNLDTWKEVMRLATMREINEFVGCGCNNFFIA